MEKTKLHNGHLPQKDPNPSPTAGFRTLEEILGDIIRGKADEITTLEWDYCFSRQRDWENSPEVKGGILQVAPKNSWLLKLLQFKCLQTLKGHKNLLELSCFFFRRKEDSEWE